MDKIFMVSILVTFVGFVASADIASMTAFQDALTNIDAQCLQGSTAVNDPCSQEKGYVETPFQSNDLTGACTKLKDYKACLVKECAQIPALFDAMEKPCGLSPSVTDFLGVLNIIDNQCTKSSAAVTDQCPIEKGDVNTQLEKDSLTEACTKLPDYKTCLLRDCVETPDLTKSIDTMVEKCSSGFIKISVSMLTLFLAAIVNFL